MLDSQARLLLRRYVSARQKHFWRIPIVKNDTPLLFGHFQHSMNKLNLLLISVIGTALIVFLDYLFVKNGQPRDSSEVPYYIVSALVIIGYYLTSQKYFKNLILSVLFSVILGLLWLGCSIFIMLNTHIYFGGVF